MEKKRASGGLNSRTSRLLANLVACPGYMQACVRSYGEQIRYHVSTHLETTGTYKWPVTHDFEGHIVQQATPAVLSLGCALITTIGYELGVGERDERNRCDKDTSRSWSREQICREVVKEARKVIRSDHTFG